MFNSDTECAAVEPPNAAEPYHEAVEISRAIYQNTTELVTALQERDMLYRKLNEIDEYIRDHRTALRRLGEQMERIVF